MNTLDREDLDVILKAHLLWIRSDPKGRRANLRGADLRDADIKALVLALGIKIIDKEE